ncbi:MAG TPA: aldo/keto reductase [Kiritimatiellia bacterium]|nr:aldo/keto reductase [Kiritimatiellia bacterium]HMO97979.1 aldo/keto reductase [Kiritimatiellia bacterium]HMP95330.1 aldo/keto reductase [Kiritimatiellia bacterium]
MPRQVIGRSKLSSSVLGLGCMRMGDRPDDDAARVLAAAVEAGITLFDHADIYAGGRSEEVFARAVAALKLPRSAYVLQSKCGIRSGFFDFSREHILASVEGSLRRLRADYLDILLLHRPDTLMEPEEVASAFSELRERGYVHHFGVSNQHPGQIALLQASCDHPLLVNQVQASLAHTPIFDHGFNVAMKVDAATDRVGGVLEYCREHGITLQAWSPLQFGFFQGVFIDHPNYGPLNETLRRIGAEQGASASAVALAWLLHHPARIQPIIGSMNPDRIRDMARAPSVTLDRAQWYECYRAAGNVLP